jgi:FKBP-type peptidyl-prolyl cis-trans isomerase
MARTQVADSATAQFFINVVDNGMLDQPRDGAAYAVFGKVVGGMDVVDKIRNTPVTTNQKLPMGQVVPKEPVVIKAVTRVGKDEAQKQAKAANEASAKADSEARAAVDKQVNDYVAKAEQEHGKKFEKTASGLMYLVLKPGEGTSPKPTDRVTVHYTGTLLDGKKFDSSRDRGQPATFALNQVIKGWTEGLGLMKPGARHLLIIPPNLGYAASPPPGSGIPPNSTLAFDVELISVGG